MTAPAEVTVSPEEAETLGQIYGFLLANIRENRTRRLGLTASTPAGDDSTARPEGTTAGQDGDHG